MTEKTLMTLKENEIGIVTAVLAEGTMRRRFCDVGCIKGAKIRMLGEAPCGGLRAYAICGAMIAIRKGDAERIRVRVENI